MFQEHTRKMEHIKNIDDMSEITQLDDACLFGNVEDDDEHIPEPAVYHTPEESKKIEEERFKVFEELEKEAEIKRQERYKREKEALEKAEENDYPIYEDYGDALVNKDEIFCLYTGQWGFDEGYRIFTREEFRDYILERF